MDMPSIQVRLTHASLHVDADLGNFDIQQPRPTFEMKRIPSRLEMRQPRGDMEIDHTKAFDALGQGGNLEMMSRIYSQAPNIVLQSIANAVEKGNRLAAIQNKTNAIADNAEGAVGGGFPEFNYAGEASYDNVDVFYTANKPEIEAILGSIEMNTEYNKPIIEYHKGKLEIYMKKYPNVEFIPPEIDYRV
jgi:hypothetical protein